MPAPHHIVVLVLIKTQCCPELNRGANGFIVNKKWHAIDLIENYFFRPGDSDKGIQKCVLYALVMYL